MTVQELMKELSVLDLNAQVLIRDGHHFMREYEIDRVEGEFSRGYNTYKDVVLVSVDAPKREDVWK